MQIETLIIPSSLKKLCKKGLFCEVSNWEKLKKIIVGKENKVFVCEGGCLINVKKKEVILGTENAVIPKWVKKIGFYAFRQRENLTEITIPESVQEIDAQAFASCHNLKKVTIEGKFTRINNACFIADTEIKEFNIPSISTGDLLRESIAQGTELGKTAKKYMDEGKLVPTELVLGLLEQRIAQDDTKNGYILDGFPRSIEQAELLDKMINVVKGLMSSMFEVVDDTPDEDDDKNKKSSNYKNL